jgi:hypothetical protein
MQAAKSFATLAPTHNNWEPPVETEELLSKLELIEEQARLTLDEFPRHLTKERQRMIISLAKNIRWMVNETANPEATIRMIDRRLS